MANPGKPPGQRLVNRMSARTKWLLLAPAGLLLIGAGLCVLVGAGIEMNTGAPFMRWFIKGTYSLILVNGGISIFGTAIRFRVMIDTRQIIRQEIKRNYKKYVKPKKAPSQRRNEARKDV
jgi:hypothetical protein